MIQFCPAHPSLGGFVVEGIGAPLAGVPFPNDRVNYSQLYDLGYRWILCLATDQPSKRYDPKPMRWLEACEAPLPYDHNSLKLAEIVRRAQLALKKLQTGEGVLVHCQQGIDRTGAMIATILRLQGFLSTMIATDLYAILRTTHGSDWTTQTDFIRIQQFLTRLDLLLSNRQSQ